MIRHAETGLWMAEPWPPVAEEHCEREELLAEALRDNVDDDHGRWQIFLGANPLSEELLQELLVLCLLAQALEAGFAPNRDEPPRVFQYP